MTQSEMSVNGDDVDDDDENIGGGGTVSGEDNIMQCEHQHRYSFVFYALGCSWGLFVRVR